MITVVNQKKHKWTTNDIQIGRPTALGNQWSHRQNTWAKFTVDTRDEAVDQYEVWLREQIAAKNEAVADALNRIWLRARDGRDVNLVCWCAPKRCHGDVIKAIIEEKL